ncbi:MAG TPA: DUF1543 domain-containing protein [Chitinophagaceae bacterium]|nr:DUF1543 domain-containing protein [Chitinophagaceae bacterium]
MLLLGSKPEGRHTEQHDVFFTIGLQLADIIPSIKEFWPEAKGDIHVDAWREVINVDGYKIEIENNDHGLIEAKEKLNRLYFINLGGYKQNEFEEFHYKMIAVAPEKGDAIRQSKQTAFYKHVGFKGATSHVDDKYGIDVDDAYGIEDILPIEIKKKYRIQISQNDSSEEDELHMGYFNLEKLKAL